MTKRYWKLAALVSAALGTVLPAAAQAAGIGIGSIGTVGTTSGSSVGSSASGAGTTGPASGGTGVGSSSPGVGRQGESETGAAVPSTAPVDNRTQQPVQIGTGEPAQNQRTDSYRRPGYGSNFYTDLTQSDESRR